jgi:hypothetical protein
LLRSGGVFGLIATNTIGQGDTRDTGLAPIIAAGGAVLRAVRRLKWPGEAAVVVSVVHVAKDAISSPVLDGRQVRRISAYLVEGDLDRAPDRLASNVKKAFVGSFVLGLGFLFDDDAAKRGRAESVETMKRLLANDPTNGERIFPYIGGEEVNNSPRERHTRYIINFLNFPRLRDKKLEPWAHASEETRKSFLEAFVVPEDYPGDVASDWPELLKIIEQRVKPERLKQGSIVNPERWWMHARSAANLYNAIKSLDRVLVRSLTSTQFPTFTFVKSHYVFDQTLIVWAVEKHSRQSVLSSRAHEAWVRFLGATMKDDSRYNVADCFETFPLPLECDTSAGLETAGRTYHDHRAALMVARNEGMTKTYNRFHDSADTGADIQRLRELHGAMDRVVLEAYGWHDLAERAAPIFLDQTNEDDHTYQGRLFWPSDFRDEVLARLLALNAERHAEEVRLGIAPGMKGKADTNDERDDEMELD